MKKADKKMTNHFTETKETPKKKKKMNLWIKHIHPAGNPGAWDC